MPFNISEIPLVSVKQMQNIDELMVRKYGIHLTQMMENAGLNLADLTRRLMVDSISGKRIMVMAGKGNNGGGGLCAARHLHNAGAEMIVLLPEEPHSPAALQQLEILQRLSLKIISGEDCFSFINSGKADFIIDALIGYGLKGRLRGSVVKLIQQINQMNLPVLSLDVPSGLNADTGTGSAVCIRALATMTLALPKCGLLKPQAKKFTGRLYLADISVPPELYADLDIAVHFPFQNGSLIELDESPGSLFSSGCSGYILG